METSAAGQRYGVVTSGESAQPERVPLHVDAPVLVVVVPGGQTAHFLALPMEKVPMGQGGQAGVPS